MTVRLPPDSLLGPPGGVLAHGTADPPLDGGGVSMAEALGYGWAVELSNPAWLHERRDAHGEWTDTPGDKLFPRPKPGKTGSVDRYSVPNPRRLYTHTGYRNPADHPFWRQHPVSAANIVDAYDKIQSEGVRAQGARWYSDVHDMATKMTGGDPEKGGILLSVYSPKNNWPGNMFNAARSYDNGKPIGPKDGAFVTHAMMAKAQRALDGQGIDTLMTSAKTHAFGALIKNGDDSPDDPYGQVVVDTHAVNVAAGGNIRGDLMAKAPINDARQHEYVADKYREAASIISHRDGVLMKPHQLQAITWMAQKLANDAQDAYLAEHGTPQERGRAKGRLSLTSKNWGLWLKYAETHDIPVNSGTTALAYQALLAQVIELVGVDSLVVQLAAWEHELRGPDGRWIKAGSALTPPPAPHALRASAGLLAPNVIPAVRLPRVVPVQPPKPPRIGRGINPRRAVKPLTVPQRRARAAAVTAKMQKAVTQAATTHVSQQQLGRAVVESKVYTASEFHRLEQQMQELKDRIDQEQNEENRSVMALHIGVILAGIGVTLALTGVALPLGIVLLLGASPSIASEFAEFNITSGPGVGKKALGHPIATVKAALHIGPGRLHYGPVSHQLAGDPVLDNATAMISGVLIRQGLDPEVAPLLAEALVNRWAEENPARLEAARRQHDVGLAVQLAGLPPPDGLIAQVIDLRFDPGELRDPHGEWTKGGGLAGREAAYQATKAQRAATHTYPQIGSEGARGNSRAVTPAEFQHLASLGNAWIDRAKRDASPITGLDQHWDQVKADSWHEVQKSWGGATIDTHTGKALPQGADVYALSVKPRGMDTVSVPDTASQDEFNQAMDRAKAEFRPALERKSFYLGVFHDDETGRIDIDPVAIVDSIPLVEQVGAYTRAIGGAYHFKSGDGFWPPHVAEGAGMANDDETTHWAGPGQWHTQAVAVQDPEPDDKPAAE